MFTRGRTFWTWANPHLHCRTKDERLADGSQVNVQVRTSSTGAVQLFLGLYAPKGIMIFEESFDSRPGQTMTQAMEWGISRAKELWDTSKEKTLNTRKFSKLPRSISEQST
ncbi:hypothetical protein [Pseudomonas synxantha]|uniref:hypothetical protein n=1 Tax=Pseudomonas synxantha TaxID=47883 RepID=UPI00345D4388